MQDLVYTLYKQPEENKMPISYITISLLYLQCSLFQEAVGENVSVGVICAGTNYSVYNDRVASAIGHLSSSSVTLNVIYCSEQSTTDPLSYAQHLIEHHNVDVLLGPDVGGDIPGVSLIAAAAQVPLIYPQKKSTGSVDFLVKIMREVYGWPHVNIITTIRSDDLDDNEIQELIGNKLYRFEDLLHRDQFTIARIDSADNQGVVEEIGNLLQSCADRLTVFILLLTSNYDISEFMLVALLNKLVDGKHVFIVDLTMNDHADNVSPFHNLLMSYHPHALKPVLVIDGKHEAHDHCLEETLEYIRSSFALQSNHSYGNESLVDEDGSLKSASNHSRGHESLVVDEEGFHNSASHHTHGNESLVDEDGFLKSEYHLRAFDNDDFKETLVSQNTHSTISVRNRKPKNWPASDMVTGSSCSGNGCFCSAKVTASTNKYLLYIAIASGIVISAYIIVIIVDFCIHSPNLSCRVPWKHPSLIVWSELNIFGLEYRQTLNLEGTSGYSLKAAYRNNLVHIRMFPGENHQIPAAEFHYLRSMEHDNLETLMGFCVHGHRLSFISEDKKKGSLQDLMKSGNILLSPAIYYSFMNDIISGLRHLHTRYNLVHGRLTSANCLVDSNFTIILSDFGYHDLFYSDPNRDFEERTGKAFKALLWRAPEWLTRHGPVDKPGDIYSLGILMNEIMCGTLPYSDMEMKHSTVVLRVLNCEQPPFRPNTKSSHDYNPDLLSLVTECWQSDPNMRPDIGQVKEAMKRLRRGKTVTDIIQHYADTLENIVAERANNAILEKDRFSKILVKMIPGTILQKMEKGGRITKVFDSVTLCLTDVVSFTSISTTLTAQQVIALIDEMNLKFDFVCSNYDVLKLDHIGDAVLLISGAPEKNENRHASEILHTALDVLELINKTALPDGSNLRIRVGVHSGPVCAGVISQSKPKYIVFGDSLNLTMKMESSGVPMRIHLTSTTKKLAEQIHPFQFEERNDVVFPDLKIHTTYLVKSNT